MSLSGVSVSNAKPNVASESAPATARAADGDYKVRSALTSQVKDADGDYRPVAASAAARSSSAVQSTLSDLKRGG